MLLTEDPSHPGMYLIDDPTMMQVAVDAITWLETVATPYTLLIDEEQVIVTACTTPPSSGVQTVTVTRGANGTTPAVHAAGAPVELAVPALFAF